MSAEIIKLPDQSEDQKEGFEVAEFAGADEVRVSFKDGKLKVKQKRQREKKPDEAEAKTASERQKIFVEAKKAAGFKRDWLHVDVIALAEEAGGQEQIASMLEAQRAVQRDLIEQQRADMEVLKDELRLAKVAVSLAETQIEQLKFELERAISCESDARQAWSDAETELNELQGKMKRIPSWIQRLFR